MVRNRKSQAKYNLIKQIEREINVTSSLLDLSAQSSSFDMIKTWIFNFNFKKIINLPYIFMRLHIYALIILRRTMSLRYAYCLFWRVGYHKPTPVELYMRAFMVDGVANGTSPTETSRSPVCVNAPRCMDINAKSYWWKVGSLLLLPSPSLPVVLFSSHYTITQLR